MDQDTGRFSRKGGEGKMNLFYSPDIHFMIENVSFSVSNIAREQFMTPVPRHVHGNGSYEFHYIASGYGTARINGSIYKLVPGTLYVTGPQVEHEQIPYLDNPMTEYAVFFVIQKETMDLSCVDQFLETPFWMGENASAIHDLLQIVFEELQDKQAGYLTQVSALLQQMVIYLIRNYQIPRPGNIAGMRTGNLYEKRAFLTDKAFLYEYREVTLARLSEYVGVSEGQTERLLKEYYGKTFAQKRRDARMSAACIFLKNEEPDLYDIAEKTGYRSIDYFVNAFKKYFQITPKRYVQLYQEGGEKAVEYLHVPQDAGFPI